MSDSMSIVDDGEVYYDRVIFENGRIRLSLVNGNPVCSWLDQNGEVLHVQTVPREVVELVYDLKRSLTGGLNRYSSLCHEANSRWWHNPATGEPIERNLGEMLMLAVSELSEAMEGARKNLNDDKLPHRKMLEVEIADCLIRLFDLCGGLGLDIDGAFLEKMEYNRTRVDHTNEARLEDGGKKW